MNQSELALLISFIISFGDMFLSFLLGCASMNEMSLEAFFFAFLSNSFLSLIIFCLICFFSNLIVKIKSL